MTKQLVVATFVKLEMKEVCVPPYVQSSLLVKWLFVEVVLKESQWIRFRFVKGQLLVLEWFFVRCDDRVPGEGSQEVEQGTGWRLLRMSG